MVDALGGHTAAQNTLGAEGLRDGDALSSTTLSNLLQGLRGNGIVRLQDTAYGSTRNAVNNQPGAVVRASTHTLTVQGGYAVLDGVLYEFAGGPGGTATVTIGSHGTGTALAASGEQSMYVVYVASQGGQAKIHVDGGSPVQTSTGLYPQAPSQFLVDYDTGGSILNDQVVALATLRCSYNAGGGTHKVDVQEVNDKRIFTRSNPIYMTPLSSGTIVTDGSELSQISRGAAEGINTAAQLNALFSGNEAGVLGNNANGSTKIDVGALWMSTGRSGTSLGYGPGDGVDRSSNRMNDDLFFAGQNNNETGVVTKRLFTEGVAAPTGSLSTASYTISSHGDKWFIFAPANAATVTLNPEKSGSTYLFPEGHVIEVCNSAAANGGNIVFDSTGLNTTLLPDQRATFIFEGSTWLRCDYQAAISTMAFTTLTDTPSSLGSAGQHIRVNSGGTAFEFIDSPTLTTEEVQDVVGGMFSGNTETNITATYQDSDGTVDLVVAEQRTDAQVKDLAGALFTGNTETFITATYQTSDDTVDLVVPVHDEDNMSSDSATHLATQQSIKAYVDTQVAGVIDSAPGALDTLNELAAAINDDASFHTTVTTALSNRVRVDTASQGLTTTQKSNARTNMGLGTMSTLSAIDISANTNLTATAASGIALTGDTLALADIPFTSLHADVYQTSSESFANNDTSLMTSAAIEDKILSYGYSTTTGTVTSVATGTGLTGGAITGSGTISLSHLGLENLSDPNADRILFWDDSAGVLKFLTAGSNLAFSGTTLNATNTNQLTTFTIRDDDDDSKTIEQGKFIKFVSATGTAGTNWSGAGTTGDPFVMTITNPDTQLTGAQVKDFAGAMFTGNTETFITATYQTSDDTVDLVVPVLDEDNMASNSASHLATQQSIKSYVDTEVSGLIDSAPGTLDTLNELAAAINDDASFHTTMTTALGNRLRVDTASQGLTGTQQSNARTNLGLGSMALLSSIDISDNTNLAAGTGIDLTGDTVSVDVSDFMTNGSDNRVVTATGADAMNAEANLTWDGTSFGIGTASPLSKVHIEKAAHDFDSSPQDGDFHLFLKASETSTAGDAVSIGFAQSSDGTTVGSKISHLVENSFSRGGLVFSTNNTASAGDTTAERMRITGAGNVGIGTASPSVPFHVAGGNNEAARFEGSGNDAFIKIQEPTGSESVVLGSTSGTGFVGSASNNNFAIRANNSNKMTITPAGKVGIGTASPTGILTITNSGHDMIHLNRTVNNEGYGMGIIGRAGNSASTTAAHEYAGMFFQIEDNTDGAEKGSIAFNTSSGGTAADQGSTHAMQITSSGRVGIGDSTPSYKLDVAGDINLTGTLRQNGNAITTYNLYDNEITLSAGTGLTGGGAFTLNQNSDETLTFNVAGLTVSELAANSLQTSGESFADNDTSLMTSAAIQDKIESYGYSTTTGDITNVSAGVGLSGGGGSGSVTLTLDMSELPDMTQAVASSEDELIILDDGADKRKLISEIPLSAFNNDSGFITATYAGDFSAERLNLEKSSGWASIEMGGSSGAFIDMKNPFSDDFDARIQSNGDYLKLIMAGSGKYIQLQTNGTERVKVEDATTTLSTALTVGVDDTGHDVKFFGATSGAYMLYDQSADQLIVHGPNDALLQLNDGNDAGSHMSVAGGRAKFGYASDSLVLSSSSGKGMLFAVNNGTFGSGEVARFDSSGKFGLGTSSPAHNLDVASNSNPTIFIRNTDAAHAADDKIGSLLFFNAEDSAGGDGSRVGAGLRYVATDAFGRGKLELTAGTSNKITGYGDAEDYTDNSITRLSINADTGAITFNSEYTFPTSDGSANQVLQTDGNGALSFAAASGGSVSAVANGANNRIATFSSADALNGESALTFDGTILDLTGNQTIDHNATNPSTDGDFAIFIDHDSSGSTATGGDKEQGGLYVNAQSDATGGDQSNEHRLYGVWSDTRVNSSGDADAVYAVYGYAEDQRNGTSGMTNISAMAGVYGVSASDATNAAPTISGMYGVYGQNSIQDTGTISNSHAVRGQARVIANRAVNTNNIRGVSSEIEIDGARSGGDITINWTRAFEAVIDHNAQPDSSGDAAVITDGYLYYGDYAVSQSDQVTNKWGLYINDEDKNYISGNVGVGTTSATAKLHVNTSGETDAFRVDVDSSDDPDSSPFVIAEDGRVGIGTASPRSDMALTLNGDGTSYEGISFDVGGSQKWKMSTDSTSMYVDAAANGMDWTFRLRDGSGTLRPQLRLDGGAQAVIIGDDGDGDSDPGPAMNRLQVNVGTNSGVQDNNDGILIVNNDESIAQNDIIGGIGFDARDGNVPSRTTEASVAIVAKAREDHGTGDKGGYLDFYYTPTDDNDDTTSRIGMRMMQGKLSVGGQGSDIGDPINSLVVEHTGSDWHNGILVLRDDTSISSGDLLGAIGFDGKDGNNPSSVLEASAGIAAYASQDHSTADKGGHLAFFTSPNDQADDTAAIERMRIKQGGTIEFKDDNANKTVKIHADTNSSPAPRLELMRGTHDTWGSGDNYTDWRIENSNDLIFYSGFSGQSSGSAVERFRVHSDEDGLTVSGGEMRNNGVGGTYSGNQLSSSDVAFNLCTPFYYSRKDVGTGTVDLRIPNGGDGNLNMNGYVMPKAGKVKAITLHYSGADTPSTSNDHTWMIRVNANSSSDTQTFALDIDQDMDNPTGTNYTTTIVDGIHGYSEYSFSAGELLQIRRSASGGTLDNVNAVLWVQFD